MDDNNDAKVTRRDVLKLTAVSMGAASMTLLSPAARALAADARTPEKASMHGVRMTVNGKAVELRLDTRTSLLDALREHLHLTGTKKGCDHGQCGACTAIVDGRRINTCLTFAVMHDGAKITTIEGLGQPDNLHAMQAAFIKHDGYQCGYCTPGQICSAVAVLDEIRRDIPSHVTANLEAPAKFSVDEVRERMSGNICRCGAYSNIVEAVVEVGGGTA
jgi:xanthine dehydrogenase YagT iron-sulfur-binding subunit